MNINPDQKLILYAQGELSGGHAKTAEGVMRYRTDSCLAIVDADHAGKTASEVSGVGGDIPILGSIEETFSMGADAMLLGCAFTGGKLPDRWRKDIIKALENGIDVINGLHDFLNADEQFVSVARENGRSLIDLRNPPDYFEVGTGRAALVNANTVLTVGTDCSVGKMTTSLELRTEAVKRGKKARFVATGQTGIMIDGLGVAIDRVIGDFMAGVVEDLVLKGAEDSDYVFVEGQGSICHPGYSPVTLSLLHGAAPRCMILCHRAGKTKVGDLDMEIPPVSSLIESYEKLAGFIRPSKVVGMAIDTSKLKEEEAHQLLERYAGLAKMPVTDPVRFGAGKLFDAIEEFCALVNVH